MDNKDTNYKPHFLREQNPGYEAANKQKLTLKQKMMILSRRDLMGKAKPTFLRTLIVTVVLIAVAIIGARIQANAWNKDLPAATPVAENEVQMSFAGDIMLGRYVETYGKQVSFDDLFRDSNALWKDSSLVFANLECTITRDGVAYTPNPDKNIKVGGSLAALQAMAKAGVNVVSTANNHLGDYGRKGIRHTLEALSEVGIQQAGAGANLDEAGRYRLLEADGLTVGFMSCSDVIPQHFTASKDEYGVCPVAYSNLYRNVMEAASYSDIMVVYVHWGDEGDMTLNDRQRDVAHQLIESGADIVIGSHPHVLQEVEQYKDGIIFYSMGNYIFDQAPRMNRNTLLVQLNVDKTTGEGCFTLVPMRVNNFHPYETTNSFYVSQIQRILLKSLEKTSYSLTEDGKIRIPMKIFEPGQKQTPPETEPATESTADTAAWNN